jgi:hypothetical protein
MLTVMGRAGLLIVALVALTGCGRGGETDNRASISPSIVGPLPERYREHYAALKQASGQPRDDKARTFDELARRTAVADSIVKSQFGDDPLARLQWLEDRNRILIDGYFKRYLKETVNEEVVRTYYEAHPDEFLDAYMRVAYLSVSGDDRGRQDPVTVAGELAERVRSGATLLEVKGAHEASGGRAVWVGELQLRASDPNRQSLFSAAEKLSLSGVSDPVETDDGVYVIKLLEGPTDKVKPFFEVKDTIREKLRRQAREAEMRRLSELGDDIDRD